jgi:hypothetical protein
LASSFGDWEKHTKGVGLKILMSMGYSSGAGLGGPSVQRRKEETEERIKVINARKEARREARREARKKERVGKASGLKAVGGEGSDDKGWTEVVVEDDEEAEADDEQDDDDNDDEREKRALMESAGLMLRPIEVRVLPRNCALDFIHEAVPVREGVPSAGVGAAGEVGAQLAKWERKQKRKRKRNSDDGGGGGRVFSFLNRALGDSGGDAGAAGDGAAGAAGSNGYGGSGDRSTGMTAGHASNNVPARTTGASSARNGHGGSMDLSESIWEDSVPPSPAVVPAAASVAASAVVNNGGANERPALKAGEASGRGACNEEGAGAMAMVTIDLVDSDDDDVLVVDGPAGAGEEGGRSGSGRGSGSGSGGNVGAGSSSSLPQSQPFVQSMAPQEVARRMFEQQQQAEVLERTLRQLRKAAVRNREGGSNPDRCIYDQACAKIAQAEACLAAARAEEKRLVALSTAGSAGGASAMKPDSAAASARASSHRMSSKKRHKTQLKHAF